MPSPLKKSFAAEQLKRQKKEMGTLPKILIAVLVIAIAGTGYLLYSRFSSKDIQDPETGVPAPAEKRSIAILPFVDLSAEKDQQYFCDGVAEEIINTLTHVEGLRVIARSSSFSFRDKDIDIREVGRQLDVETVLEGSVRKVGNQYRITAQLVNVVDGSHLFSETYDRESENVLAMQNEISQEILKTFNITMLRKAREAIMNRYTRDLKAYDLYLLGLNAGEYESIDYFQQAIDKDPTFTLAYNGIAQAYIWGVISGNVPPDEAFPEASEMLEKALAINNFLAEAHTCLAMINLYYDWDWQSAERRFKQAIALEPGNAWAHYWYAVYHRIHGQFDEALVEARRTQELDPLSLWLSHRELIAIYSHVGNYDKAMEQFHKARKINPNFSTSWATGSLYWPRGKYQEAIEVFQRDTLAWNRARLGITYALSGEREKAEQILTELLERRKNEFVPSLCIAAVYCGLRENDLAFEWFDKAYEERNSNLIFIKVWPEFENIRSDPRYKTLLKKMGLDT